MKMEGTEAAKMQFRFKSELHFLNFPGLSF